MAYSIIGLDRGSCTIKAVIMERAFRGYAVKGVRQVPVPQDGSGPPTPEATKAALEQLLSEFDPEAVGYVVASNADDLSTWVVPLPFSDQRRIEQTLPFELENYVPFDLDEMVLDYEVVRTSADKSRVVAGLMPRSRMTTLLQDLAEIKVDPQAVVSDTYALTYVPPGKEGGERPVAVVDLGHCQTLVTVRVGSTPDFLRTLPVGGLQVTQALMDAFKVTYATAEKMKMELGPIPYTPEDLLLHGVGRPDSEARGDEVLEVPPSTASGSIAASVLLAAQGTSSSEHSTEEGSHAERPTRAESSTRPLPDEPFAQSGYGRVPEETVELRAPGLELPETPARSFDDSGDWGSILRSSLEGDITDPNMRLERRRLEVRPGRASSDAPDWSMSFSEVEEGRRAGLSLDRDEDATRQALADEVTAHDLPIPSASELRRSERMTDERALSDNTPADNTPAESTPAEEQAHLAPAGPALPSAEDVQAVVWEAMLPIFREIRNALMAYEAGEKREIAAVLIVGGGALLKGLDGRLTDYLGVPVASPTRFGPEQVTLENEANPVRFALSFALSYLGAAEGRYGVLNFRKAEFAYRRNYEAVRGYLVAAIVLFCVGLVALTGYFISQVQEKLAQADNIEGDIADAIGEAFPDLSYERGQSADKVLALVLEEQQKLKDRGAVLGLGDHKKHALDILKEISVQAPAREELTLDLDEFQLEGDQLRLRGTTGSFDDVEKIEKALQNASMVKEIKNDVSSKDGKKFFTFTITLKGPDDDPAS
ncbi:MAG: type II secretion system protein GspL [Myxococcota bacterium]